MVNMRKYIKFILFALLAIVVQPTQQVHAQIAKTHNYTAAGTSGSPNQTVLSGVATSGSTLIVVGLTSFGGTAAPTLMDNLGNSYGPSQLAASADAPSSGPRIRIYYIYGASIGSASHTFTCSTGASAGYSSIYVATYTGTLYTSNPLDQVATLSATGVLNASVTPTVDGALVFAMTTSSTLFGAAPTITGSFSPFLNSNPFASGGSFLGASANLIQVTAATATPAFNYSSANSAAATISFKPDVSNDTNSGFW